MSKGILDYEVGEAVDVFLLIKSTTKGIASNQKPYLSIIFQDSSGEIEAKLWDVSEEVEKTYKPETIVRLAGDIQNFRGRLQLRIKHIRTALPTDDVQISDFLERAPISMQVLKEQVYAYLEQINNPTIHQLTERLLKKYEASFFEYPAATKNHHEFVSGLAYHVVTMLKLAESIANIYPSLNKDLLYSGVILHDLGKVIELSGPISTSYTVEGNLLGHITIMVSEIAKVAEELQVDGDEVLVLQHLVLTHHGKAEWGSPKAPMIKEAEILHFIDNIDAKMNMMDRALERVKPGEFTERIFALENRSFYQPKI